MEVCFVVIDRSFQSSYENKVILLYIECTSGKKAKSAKLKKFH